MHSQQTVLQLFYSFIKCLNCTKGSAFWKFNNSLICNSNFVDEMKTFIHNTKIFLDQNDSFSNQSEWEFLKYEIRKGSIAFAKALAKRSEKEHVLLLSKITKSEQYFFFYLFSFTTIHESKGCRGRGRGFL